MANFTPTEQQIKTLKGMYRVLLGREGSDQEVTDWLNWGQGDLGKIEEAIKGSDEYKYKSYNEPTLQEGSTDWIKQLYESSYPEIESAVKSAASQRGGMDTGGYLTSVAKGKASTWQDMLKSLISNQQYQQTFGESKRQFDVGQQTQKDITGQYYQAETAKAKASQPNWLDYILKIGEAVTPWSKLLKPSIY